MCGRLTQLRQPFCTALLNIDTHIDFSHIPDNVVLPKGKIESDRAFSYFDYALRLFFAKAQQQPWFANTIFVFLGDHYSRSGQQKAQSAVGKHQIPLWIYAPDGSIAPHETNKPVQQTDIGATALTLAGYAGKTFDFGESLLDTTRQRYAMFLENDFWLLDDSLALQYNEKNEKAVGLFFYKKDNQLVNNVLKNYEKEKNNLTLQVQARLQTINNALIDDKLQ